MKSQLVAVLTRIADRLDALDDGQTQILGLLNDKNNGLAAIRMKQDIVFDDHDQALVIHAKKHAMHEARNVAAERRLARLEREMGLQDLEPNGGALPAE